MKIHDKIAELVKERKKIAIVGEMASGKSYLIQQVLAKLNGEDFKCLLNEDPKISISNIFHNDFVDMFHDLIVIDSGDLPQFLIIENDYKINDKVCSIIYAFMGTIENFNRQKALENEFDVVIHVKNRQYTFIKGEVSIEN